MHTYTYAHEHTCTCMTPSTRWTLILRPKIYAQICIHIHIPVHGQPMSLATKAIPRNEVTFSPFSPFSWALVLSSLVKGATVSSNRPRHECPSGAPLQFRPPPPPRHLGSMTAANSVSFDLFVSCSSCWGKHSQIKKKMEPMGPRWDGGPAGSLIEFEVSSLGCPDYATINGVRTEQDGRHLIYFKGRFYRPVEPSDLKK